MGDGRLKEAMFLQDFAPKMVVFGPKTGGWAIIRRWAINRINTVLSF
jgi:hypothetical protein